MSRRRRQKNNLLPKMIGLAVLVNAILLPILSQLGAFKAITTRYTEVKLIKLPPPEKKPAEPKKKDPPKPKTAKTKPHPAARRTARAVPARPSRPNPNQPKVVASASTGKGGGGPEIDNSGTAIPGKLPGGTTTPPPVTTATVTPPPVVVAPPPPVEPVKPPVETPVQPVPHEAVTVAAAPIDQPRPALPDDMLDTELRATFKALFTIHPDGKATVKIITSTGNADLDKLALQAAQRWTFRPATVDGKPVESYLRLAVEFEVS